jgi:glycosyltransferase domain-containing protein
MENKLTIVLLTFNRPKFLLRFVKYYNYFKFPFKLIIADGSKKEINTVIYSEITKNKNILYKAINKNFYHRIYQSLKLVNTEYVKFAADDDFFFKTTIEKCINYLSINKNYNIAGGKFINFELKNNLYYDYLFNLNYIYDVKDLTSNNTQKKLIKFYRSLNSNIWFVQRTKILLKSVKLTLKVFNTDIEFRDHFFETINVLKGKRKMFSQPLVMHQFYNNSEASKRPSMLERLRNKNFLQNLKKFDLYLKKVSLEKKLEFDKLYFQNVISKDSSLLNFNNNKLTFIILLKLLVKKIIKKILFKKNITKSFHIQDTHIKKEVLKIQEFLLLNKL